MRSRSTMRHAHSTSTSHSQDGRTASGRSRRAFALVTAVGAVLTFGLGITSAVAPTAAPATQAQGFVSGLLNSKEAGSRAASRAARGQGLASGQTKPGGSNAAATETSTDVTGATQLPSGSVSARAELGTSSNRLSSTSGTSAASSPPPKTPAATPPSTKSTASQSAASKSTTSTSTSASKPPSSSTSPSGSTSTSPSAPVQAPSGISVAAGTWLSGASGTGVASGEFANWRGSGLGIAGTWADNNEAQVELSQLYPGGEYGSWGKSIDIAVGAIDEGETWALAARGAYDGRWRQSLTKLRSAWGSRAGTVYIRFAHEMNGDWYGWSVNAGNHQDFIQAWKRFRTLQKEIFPAAKLVFCVNRESIGNGIDWRKTFPGAQYVDVMGVDYYNNWPYVGSQADWDASKGELDGTGAPKGLQAHLDFARSVGLPLSVPEWSGKASAGDSPAFVKAMHDFFARNAGGGAGQVAYEVQFNIDMHDNDYRFYGGTKMPASAEEYKRLF